MATYRFERDGMEFEFDSDLPPDEAMRRARGMFDGKAKALSDDIVKMKNSMLDSIGFGAREPLRGAAQGLYNALPGKMQQGLDDASAALHEATGGRLGRPAGQGYNQFVNAEAAKYQQGDDGGWDWGRMAGNVIGAAPMAFMGLPSTLSGAAAVGAGQGMLQPVYGPDNGSRLNYLREKAAQAGLGAATAGLMHGFGAATGGMKPKPGLDMLRDAGVNPTFGQAMGGFIDGLEQKTSSAGLGLGDAVNLARQSARDQFNQATINKALGPIGGSVDTIGHQAIAAGHNLVDDAYNAARNMVGDFVPDIKQAHGAAQSIVDTLSDEGLKTYRRVVKGLTKGRQGLTGETWKQLDSELGNLAATYGRSGQATDKQVGRALGAFQQNLRGQVSDLFPDAGKAFSQADAAHAMMVRIDQAANAAGLKDGVFTPGQLVNAVKSADQSVRRNQFAEGGSLLQDWAQAGQRVLGDKYPDSGTPGRILAAGGALGGLAHFSPTALVASLAASAGAHPIVQKRLIDMVTRDPSQAESIIRSLLPYTSGAITGELQR